jgi:hypothetical protein
MSRRLAGVSLAALVVALVCSVRAQRECVDRVRVQAEAPAAASFTWRARCRVTQLTVWRDTAVVWRIEGRLRSPIHYGILPPGARGAAGPREALRPGVAYYLDLEYDDPAAMTGTGISQEFRIAP